MKDFYMDYFLSWLKRGTFFVVIKTSNFSWLRKRGCRSAGIKTCALLSRLKHGVFLPIFLFGCFREKNVGMFWIFSESCARAAGQEEQNPVCQCDIILGCS